MDKDGKKASKNTNFSNLPKKRGNNEIKGKIADDFMEALNFMVSKKSGDCGGNTNQERDGRAFVGSLSRVEDELVYWELEYLKNNTIISSFGIAFDIDGVILRGANPIGNSRKALRRLYDDSGSLKIPYLFLTNGGGTPESRRAFELSEILGVKIFPSQVVQGHSSFRTLLKSYENEFIVATGKGEPAVVMSEYGFKRVVSLDEYAAYFTNIDPVAQYKRWTTIQKPNFSENSENIIRHDYSQKVKAAFVISDPVDWGRDIQVLCDILTSGGVLGEKNWHQPPLYFAADDLQYQAAFPSERLGMGAFRIALESVFNRIHEKPLELTYFGKPNPFVFRNAETILEHILQTSCTANARTRIGTPSFKTLYMIGDNPPVDIKGAQLAGYPWFSILTRTGVFRQRENHTQYPADMVVDTVEDAVEFILRREAV